MRNSRLLELDALRGLAAIAVVFYHYFFRYDQLYGHSGIATDWTWLGQYGVHLFFIVSGFVIFWTLHRIRRPADFIVSRFSRLYPAYWAAAALTFLVIYFMGLPGREISVSSALKNVLMFHSYLGVPHIDGVYWTLTVELTFYFWMFAVYLSGYLEKAEFVFIPVLLLAVLKPDAIAEIEILQKLFILKYAPLFLAGICFYRLMEGRHQARSLAFLALSLTSTLFIYSVAEFLVFTVLYGFFYLAVIGKLPFLRAGFLVFVGSISYSFYLLHQNIGFVVLNKGYELGWHPLFSVAVSISLTAALAWVFFRFIEKPSLRAIRHYYKSSASLQRLSERLSLPDTRQGNT